MKATPVFISYASKDRKVAMTICAALEHRGLTCWISSRDVAPGENFQESIVRAMRAAKVMVLIFTGNANNSSEIKKEVALAGQFNLVCIPVRVEDVTRNDAFTYEFATRQWVDLFDDWEQALERLMLQISALIGDPRQNLAAAAPEPPNINAVAGVQLSQTEPASPIAAGARAGDDSGGLTPTAAPAEPASLAISTPIEPAVMASVAYARQMPEGPAPLAAISAKASDSAATPLRKTNRKAVAAVLIFAVLLVFITMLMGIRRPAPAPQQDDISSVVDRADAGDPAAQTELGDIYRIGLRGQPQDAARAAIYYEKAALQGHIEAQKALAALYDNGEGVPKDEKEATSWYRKAADQGDAAAEVELASRYALGTGLPVDEKRAASWYRKAAEQGNAGAEAELGERYSTGTGVPRDEAQSLAWYQKAAEQDDYGAIMGLARAYESKNYYAKALNWYRKAAEQLNLAEDQRTVASFYRDGKGTATDYGQALEWFGKAAAQGDAEAQNELGVLNYDGHGAPQNYAKAFELFRSAAEQDNAAAQDNLGYLYENGQGVGQDYAQAMVWFQKSCDQGRPSACRNLGRLYERGLGVAQDLKAARSWMKKGADAGDSDAKAWLAQHKS